MHRRVAHFVAALLLSITGAAAADYQDGVDAYRDGDYETALGHFKALAGKGVALAYTNLGYMHALGEGVEPDLEEAARWFQKAAEAGVVAAQLTLGVMYFNGEGVERSYPHAYAWLNLAATSGRSDALDYMTTVMVRMDDEEGAKAQKLSRKLFNQFGDPDLDATFTRRGLE